MLEDVLARHGWEEEATPPKPGPVGPSSNLSSAASFVQEGFSFFRYERGIKQFGILGFCSTMAWSSEVSSSCPLKPALRAFQL